MQLLIRTGDEPALGIHQSHSNCGGHHTDSEASCRVFCSSPHPTPPPTWPEAQCASLKCSDRTLSRDKSPGSFLIKRVTIRAYRMNALGEYHLDEASNWARCSMFTYDFIRKGSNSLMRCRLWLSESWRRKRFHPGPGCQGLLILWTESVEKSTLESWPISITSNLFFCWFYIFSNELWPQIIGSSDKDVLGLFVFFALEWYDSHMHHGSTKTKYHHRASCNCASDTVCEETLQSPSMRAWQLWNIQIAEKWS